MTGPLEGYRIIELAGLGPGPFCGMMLADHGAEVIRVDRIGGNMLVTDPKREFLNRSRKNIEINLKDPRGLALVRRLCAGAHGVVEGFRPGVMERLGLAPEELLRANPKLVIGRMTGWGQDGPYAGMAGHDINYIALSGALHAIGRSGGAPTPPLNLVGDFGGGGMMLAFGIVAALLSAQKTGKGQIIDCAMSEGSALLMAMMYSLRAQGKWADARASNFVDSGAHYYDAYETADGKFIAIGAVEPQFYRLLLDGLGFADDPDLTQQNDPRLWPAQKAKIAVRIKSKTRAEWCEIFDGGDACFAPVMALDEAADHAHNKARGAFVDVDGVRQPAPAPRYSVTKTSPPAHMATGEGVASEVLASAGLAREEIIQLRRDGVLG